MDKGNDMDFAAKTVARIDEKLNAGLGDAVLLQDAKQCLMENEEYIRGLELKVKKYEEAAKPILSCDLEGKCLHRHGFGDVVNAIDEAQKLLKEVSDGDGVLGLEGHRIEIGRKLPFSIANEAIAKQSGVFLTSRCAKALRKMLVRYSNVIAALGDSADPRYSTDSEVLNNWVNALDEMTTEEELA